MTSLKRRRVLEAIAATFGTALMSACGGGGDGGTETTAAVENPTPATTPTPTLTVTAADTLVVYSDPADTRIVGGTLATGDKFTLAGVKSADGQIQQARNMVFFDQSENISSAHYVAEENKLVGQSDIGQITLIPPTATSGWGFGLLAGNQQLEMQLPLNTSATTTTPPTTATQLASKKAVMSSARHGGARVVFKLSQEACAPCSIQSSLAALSKSSPLPVFLAQTKAVNAPIVDVDLTGCPGTAPQVYVYLRDQAGNILDRPIAKAIGNNRYSAALKNTNINDAAKQKAAEDVIKLLKEFELFEGGFDAAMSKLKGVPKDQFQEDVVKHLQDAGKLDDTLEQMAEFMNMTPDDVAQVQKINKFKTALGNALGSLFKGVDAWDKLKKSVIAGDALASIIDAQAGQDFNQIQIQAVVKTSKGEKFVSEGSGLISPDGPFPTLSVEVKGVVEVSGVKLDPAAPTEGQDYFASGTISCIAQNDEVLISVLGSDGYSDSSGGAAGAPGTQTFTLRVPGANSGVQDVVTLQIKRNGAIIGTQTASLVFS